MLIKHIIIYGSEESIDNALALGHLVRRYLNFNTVLHGGSTNSLFNQIKGGSVDKGGPVRKAAKELHDLLVSKHEIYRLRNELADPDSLVPVGDKSEIAFQSEEHARSSQSKKFSSQKQLKSNLAKDKNGFGSGFNPRDSSGRLVVGAAHSIEEMLAAARKEETRYCDDTNDPQYKRRQEQLKLEKERKEELKKKKQQAAANVDLLDFSYDTSNSSAVNGTNKTTVNDVFDVFDTPVQSTPVITVEDSFQEKLRKQEEEIQRLRREMNNCNNASNLNSFSIKSGNNNEKKKHIMGASSGSAHLISSLDIMQSTTSNNITSGLPTAFNTLSMTGMGNEPSSPPPLPSVPPPSSPPPLPTEPTPIPLEANNLSLSQNNYQYSERANDFNSFQPMGGHTNSNTPDVSSFNGLTTNTQNTFGTMQSNHGDLSIFSKNDETNHYQSQGQTYSTAQNVTQNPMNPILMNYGQQQAQMAPMMNDVHGSMMINPHIMPTYSDNGKSSNVNGYNSNMNEKSYDNFKGW